MIRSGLAAAILAFLLSGTVAAAEDPPAPGPEARCPVCGMFVAPHPHWVAAIVLEDGRSFYFDGPKDMFRFFFELPTYLPGLTAEAVSRIYVTEYYSLRPVAAQTVYFVTGSDVLGPMGKELVPVAGLETARTFQRDHGGAKLMRFDGSALVEVPAAE